MDNLKAFNLLDREAKKSFVDDALKDEKALKASQKRVASLNKRVTELGQEVEDSFGKGILHLLEACVFDQQNRTYAIPQRKINADKVMSQALRKLIIKRGGK